MPNNELVNIPLLIEPLETKGYLALNGKEKNNNILFGLTKKPSFIRRTLIRWFFGWYYIDKNKIK